MIDSLLVFAATFTAVVLLMLTVWIISLIKRDVSIVDVFWGLGFTLIANVTCVVAHGYPPRKLLITILTSLWGLRLAGYLLWRNWGHEEDYRYQAMRRQHGDRFWIVSLYLVFGLQGALMWVVSLPVQIAQSAIQPVRLTWLDGLGAVVWLIGLSFEAVGDWQLARFKADPTNRGKVMDQGLWRYTRHPNYFGDAVVWWGLFLIALATPIGIWSAIGPAVMTFFLMNVSGVALLERKLKRTRPQYADYVRRTSAFVPWLPRRS